MIGKKLTFLTFLTVWLLMCLHITFDNTDTGEVDGPCLILCCGSFKKATVMSIVQSTLVPRAMLVISDI